VHTAHQLDESLFDVAIDGRPAGRGELLGEWGPLHRFGIVAHKGFQTVGASFLLQLAITAFYDARPVRRSRERPVYPDVFVFHVGGRFGDHAYFDVYPPRKEIFVRNEAALILEAINSQGITHLAVPDRAPQTVRHHWKEPAQALDRLVAAWAYAGDGRPREPDVTITASSPRAEANAKISLKPERSYHERQRVRAERGDIVVPPEESLVSPQSQEEEVPAVVRERIWAARTELDGATGRTESYRRLDPAEALHMLHCGNAPGSD
jgi:hypothetical protein